MSEHNAEKDALSEAEHRLASVAREFEPSPYSFGFSEAIRIIREVRSERTQMEPCAEFGQHPRGGHNEAVRLVRSEP